MRTTELAQQLKHEDYSVMQMSDGSAVLMDLRQEVLLTLNETGAFMLACLREGANATQIVERVLDQFEVEADTAQRDVAGFLHELAKALGAG